MCQGIYDLNVLTVHVPLVTFPFSFNSEGIIIISLLLHHGYQQRLYRVYIYSLIICIRILEVVFVIFTMSQDGSSSRDIFRSRSRSRSKVNRNRRFNRHEKDVKIRSRFESTRSPDNRRSHNANNSISSVFECHDSIDGSSPRDRSRSRSRSKDYQNMRSNRHEKDETTRSRFVRSRSPDNRRSRSFNDTLSSEDERHDSNIYTRTKAAKKACHYSAENMDHIIKRILAHDNGDYDEPYIAHRKSFYKKYFPIWIASKNTTGSLLDRDAYKDVITIINECSTLPKRPWRKVHYNLPKK